MKMMGTSDFPGVRCKRIVVFFALLTLLSGLSLGVFLAPLVSASEQVKEPQWSVDEGAYLISSLAELNWIRNDLGNNYVLAADIDASPTSGWNEGAGWGPIGNADTPFTGTLDGRGHIITGLCIDRPEDSDVGLFGYAENAGFASVGLVNVSVTGKFKAGALVGESYGISVENSYATGNISGVAAAGLVGWLMNGSTVVGSYASVNVSSGENLIGVPVFNKTAGGLVSWADSSSIEGSYADGNVSCLGYSGDPPAGGLVGKMTGASAAKSSHASGTVTNEKGPSGGLVGWMLQGSSVVENSYAAATVHTAHSVGGLVGKMGIDPTDRVVVKNSYADSSVSNEADFPCGGLVGWLYGSVKDSYATGSASASGPGPTGGLVGKMDFGSIVKNCYTTTSVSSGGPACDLVGWVISGTIIDSMAENRMVENEELIGHENSATIEGRVVCVSLGDIRSVELYTVSPWKDYPDLSAPWDMVVVEPGANDECHTWNIIDGRSCPFVSWGMAPLQLTLSPEKGFVKTTVTLNGKFSERTDEVKVLWNGEEIPTVPPTVETDVNGFFTAEISVPDQADLGEHEVTAVAPGLGENVSAIFTVESVPQGGSAPTYLVIVVLAVIIAVVAVSVYTLKRSRKR